MLSVVFVFFGNSSFFGKLKFCVFQQSNQVIDLLLSKDQNVLLTIPLILLDANVPYLRDVNLCPVSRLNFSNHGVHLCDLPTK